MAPRILHPLPLFDEQALLSACAHADPPIPHSHATAVWKAVLRAELDQFHPGYAERLASRLASRAASRAASRNGSRRPSIGSAASPSSAAAGSQAIAEGDEKEEEETHAEEEKKEEDAHAEAPLVPAAETDDKEQSVDSAQPAASMQSAAAAAAELALRQDAALKLEAEDDARLEGLSVFPRSRFAPLESELRDPHHAVHSLRVVTPELVPRLPARMYPLLADKFSMLTSRLQSFKTSADGSTTKLLIRLQDGQHIETVIMRHKTDVLGRPEQRITICVSSQVGCAMGCTFCATGTMGQRANLMAGEILEQLVIANRFERIRNVVFMGMGEPLKNYDAVLSAIRGMSDPNRFGLAPSRITLSTVGVVPRMLDLTRDAPAVQLALSLHAPTQELRQRIVPTAKSWPLEKLLDAADYYIQRSRRRILIEYVMLEGVNSSEVEAHQLGELLKGKEVLINLIPYNSTAVAAEYRAPSKEACAKFQSILSQQYGLFTTTRIEMGADIDGACGQLALENQEVGLVDDEAATASAASSVMKPRGLMDDTATVSEEMLAQAGCTSPTDGGDIEDMGPAAANSSSNKTAAKQRAAAIIAKRRAAAAVAAESATSTAAAAASSSASAVAAASPSSPLLSGASDAERAASAEGLRSRRVGGAPDADSVGVSDDDNDFLTPAQVAQLRFDALKTVSQPTGTVVAPKSSARDGAQIVVLVCLLLAGLALMHDSGIVSKIMG